MKFSIIIPTYNRAASLKRCLESLCQQTYRDFEVLVVDDGSTDETPDVIRSFEDSLNLRSFFMKNSGSPIAPRNMGIENAKADWIAFLDSDDYWFPQKLIAVEPYTVSHSMIYHRMDIYDNDGKWMGKGRNFSIESNPVRDLLTLGNGITTSSVVVHKKLVQEGFLTSRAFQMGEDYELWLRAASQGAQVKFIDKNLGALVRGNSDHFSRQSDSGLSDLEWIYETYLPHLSHNDQKEARLQLAYKLASLKLQMDLPLDWWGLSKSFIQSKSPRLKLKIAYLGYRTLTGKKFSVSR